MKTFDFSRFLNVARWDLTINRKFYIRQLVVITGCVLAPIILRYVRAIYSFLIMNDTISFSEFKGIVATSFHNMDSLNYYFGILYFCIVIQMLCYMFHNLTTKQGRINELTLPATNKERFIWHVVSKVFGTILVFYASIALADLVHMFLGWAVFGITDPQSLILEAYKTAGPQEILVNYNGTTASQCSLMAFFILLVLCFYSTFAFGSAYKYKHTFGYVLLFHVIFWIVAVVLFGLAACLFIHSDFSNVLDFVESIPRWLRRTILILPLATLFCTMWWYIYRMYCRAQITTRRNP